MIVRDLMRTILKRVLSFPMCDRRSKGFWSPLRKDTESAPQAHAQEAQVLPVGFFYPPILSSPPWKQRGNPGFYRGGCPWFPGRPYRLFPRTDLAVFLAVCAPGLGPQWPPQPCSTSWSCIPWRLRVWCHICTRLCQGSVSPWSLVLAVQSPRPLQMEDSLPPRPQPGSTVPWCLWSPCEPSAACPRLPL